jgi:hypothetical protein
MKYKKIVFLILIISLIFTLTSCNNIINVISDTLIASQSPTEEPVTYVFDPYATELTIDNVDTHSAHYVASLQDFYTYADSCYASRHRSIFVRGDLWESFPELEGMNRYILKGVYKTTYSGSGSDYYAIYEFEYYPGDSVVYAYKNKDTSLLSDKEKELYDFAVNYINSNIFETMSDYEKEVAVHNYICSTLVYQDKGENDLESYSITSAYGLLNGRANCQGYTDAFYMFMNMLGIDCEKVSGSAEGAAHAWNVVEIDSRWYYCDVTFDDTALGDGEHTFAYLNAPKEYFDRSHTFDDWQDLHDSVGYGYFYYSRIGIMVLDANEFKTKVYDPLAAGQTYVEVFIFTTDVKPMLDSLDNMNIFMSINYCYINGCTLLKISTEQ